MATWVTLSFFLVLAQSSKAFDWQDNNGGPVRWAKDCDFEDIATSEKQLDSFEKCGALCLETRNCDHFTWTNGGVCKMKYSNYTVQESHKFEPLAVNQSGAVCGFLQISWNKDVNNTSLGTADWAYNCLIFGIPNARFLPSQISKKEECIVLCRNNSDCNGFTWKPDGQCVMTAGGYVIKEYGIYDPHSFCGVVEGRNPNSGGRLLWLYIVLAIITFCITIYLVTVKCKLVNRFCPKYSR